MARFLGVIFGSLLFCPLLVCKDSSNDELLNIPEADQEDAYCTTESCQSRNAIRQDCDLLESVQAFQQKRLAQPMAAMESDPYQKTMDADEERLLRSVIDNPQINCGLRYLKPDRIEYALKTFPNEYETSKAGYMITHYGRCGACSTLQDLSLYLALHSNLTVLARQCAFFTFVSDSLSGYCFRKLGFSDSCAMIWLYNSKNTRRHCWWTCLKSWVFSEPHNTVDDKDQASLNACLQCDEDASGLIFKYYAGRTRRNSGIVSGIGRSKSEIRNMTHCYY